MCRGQTGGKQTEVGVQQHHHALQMIRTTNRQSSGKKTHSKTQAGKTKHRRETQPFSLSQHVHYLIKTGMSVWPGRKENRGAGWLEADTRRVSHSSLCVGLGKACPPNNVIIKVGGWQPGPHHSLTPQLPFCRAPLQRSRPTAGRCDDVLSR